MNIEHPSTNRLDHLIGDSIDLRPGELVVAYSLVVGTRGVDQVTGEEVMRRLRFAPDGADPHMSLGLLDAAAAQLRHEITGGVRTP